MRHILLASLLIAGCHSAETPMDGAPTDAGFEARVPVPLPEAAPPVTGPTTLSQTGLYSDFASRTLSPGIFRYAVRYPFWADGAEKDRFVLIPAGSKIDTTNMDFWSFPIGTKVWKEFRVGGKAIETRLLWKRTDAGSRGWWMASYVWSADGSEATLAADGVVNALGTTHDVPSQQDCATCHDNVGDVIIGVSAIQLSGSSAAAGDAGADAGDAGDAGTPSALLQLAAMNLLSVPPAGDFTVPGSGNVQNALGYLHGNCGHCHNDRSGLAGQTAMRLRVSTTNTTPQDTPTYKTAIGLKTRHIMPPDVDTAVVPGLPDQSQLYLRATSRGNGWAMPPLATKEVDAVGSVTLRNWILGL